MFQPAALLAVLALASAPLRAAPPAKAGVPAGSATIGALEGSPQVLLDGVEPWVPAQLGMQLTPGSRVRTGDGAAVLVFFDGSKVRISERAEFTLESAQPSAISLFLSVGRLQAWVAKLRSRTFKTRTPTSVAAVRGTVFDESTDGKVTAYRLFQGLLAVDDNLGRFLLLTSGHSVETLLNPPAGGLHPRALPQGTGVPPPPVVALGPPPGPRAPGQQAMQAKNGRNPPPPNGTQPPPDGTQPPPPPPPSPTQNNLVAPISPSSP